MNMVVSSLGDCCLVPHNTVPGTDALLGNMLTKQSRWSLPRFTRMLHTVPKTVILFIWWCTTQSLGLLPVFKPYWPNSLWDCCCRSNYRHQTTFPKTVAIPIRWCTTQSLGLLSYFEPKWPNNIPQDCNHIHTVVHNTVPGTAFVLWTTVTKQQAFRLWPYSCSCTTYSLSLWDCCSSSNHFDQTKVPGTVTRVYENATYSPQDCKLIHMVVHNTVPETAALLRTMPTKQSRRQLKQSLVILL